MVEEIHRIPLQGYLERKTKSRFLPVWRRWYCVLNGRLLLFYKCQTDYEDVSKFHDMLDMGLVYNVIEAPGVEQSISVSSHNGLVILRFRTQSLCQIWLRNLEAARVLKDPSSTSTEKRFSRQPSRESNIRTYRHSLVDGTPPATSCLPKDIPPLKTGQRFSTLDGRLSKYYEGNDSEDEVLANEASGNDAEVFVSTRSLEKSSRIRTMAAFSYASLSNFLQIGRGSSSEILTSEKAAKKSPQNYKLKPTPQKSPRPTCANLPTNANVNRFLSVAPEETVIPIVSVESNSLVLQEKHPNPTPTTSKPVIDVTTAPSVPVSDKRKKSTRRKSSLNLFKNFFKLGKKENSREDPPNSAPETSTPQEEHETEVKLRPPKEKEPPAQQIYLNDEASELKMAQDSVKLWVDTAKEGISSPSCYSAPPTLPARRFSASLHPNQNDVRPLSLNQTEPIIHPPQLPVKKQSFKMRSVSPFHDMPRSIPIPLQISGSEPPSMPRTTNQDAEEFPIPIAATEDSDVSLSGDTNVNYPKINNALDGVTLEPELEPDAEWIETNLPDEAEAEAEWSGEWSNSVGIDPYLSEPLLDDEAGSAFSGSIATEDAEIAAKVVEVIFGDGEQLKSLPLLKRRNSDYDIPRPHPIALLRKAAEEEQKNAESPLQATRFINSECQETDNWPNDLPNVFEYESANPCEGQQDPATREKFNPVASCDPPQYQEQELRAVLVRSDSKVSDLVRQFDRNSSEEMKIRTRTSLTWDKEQAEKRLSFAAMAVLLVQEETVGDLPPSPP